MNEQKRNVLAFLLNAVQVGLSYRKHDTRHFSSNLERAAHDIILAEERRAEALKKADETVENMMEELKEELGTMAPTVSDLRGYIDELVLERSKLDKEREKRSKV